MRQNNSGFSLLELMIAIAIVGIVSALAVPAYRAYIETANMTKTNAAYENAVRVARETFAKQESRAALGLTTNVPTTSEGWINLLDKDNQVRAPGGGPAYVSKGNQGEGKGNSEYGDPEETGAVVINVTKDGAQVVVDRPAYLDLKPYRARIGQDSLEYEEL